ncbi:hypothetical protein ACE1OC_40310 [Streptomyces sp. DSM 116496]|uniref:hypothetical protein n=1 Tax=Streptomyces stoeckheimensis TaxID=3344656 RepID=UPI0038B2703C
MEQVERVLSAGQFGMDHGAVRDGTQSVDEVPGAFDGCRRVFGAVCDEERWRTGVEVRIRLVRGRRCGEGTQSAD